ncbi:MAG: hypothetical protein M3Z08_10105 [Chloroflexota bacterium]|nr:hypothetical protein [Chloroflexota bacterium]
MRCNSCQAPLPPGTATCPTCGAATPYNATPSEAPLPSTPGPAPLYNAGAEPTSGSQYDTFTEAGTSPASSQPPVPPWEFPYSTDANQSSPATPQQFPYSAGANQPPPSPYPGQYQAPFIQPRPPARARRGFSATTILLVVLALLILLSGLGLVFYATVYHPTQLKAQATATVSALFTADTRSTAIANTQATGTAQAYTNATATAQAQATVAAQATTTALDAIYTQATSSRPALDDPLAGQDGNNWDQGQATGGEGCFFAGGALHVSIQSSNSYLPCMANATNFRNFAFQVQAKILTGDQAGLIFRGNNSTNKFYLVDIGRDGSCSLLFTQNNGHSMVLAETPTTVVKTGLNQVNLITVIARGSTMSIYINKQFVLTTSDSTYASGQIGVFAADGTRPTEAIFTHAQVWAL